MKRLIFFLLLGIVPKLGTAQKVPRFAIMDDWVREYLSAEWDVHAQDSVILERGYCLTYQLDFWAGELAYRVTQISKGDSVEADANGISFTCPKGKNKASLHVHPPQTCESDTGPCWNGGSYSFQCFASEQDQRVLAWLKQPFGMVQCDRSAVIGYFPKPKGGG